MSLKNGLKKISVFRMEEKIAFECFLYEDEKDTIINDIDFCVDKIVLFPKIRPHQLEKAVRLSVEYCQIDDFHRKILEKANKCPVLIYQLFKRGVFVFEEINPILKNSETYLLCYYFRKEIEGFETFMQRKYKPYGFDDLFIKNQKDIDYLIEYGFKPSSIEYCLKYDVIDDFVAFEDLVVLDNLYQKAEWNPFEWSFKPEFLDFLSFSGFFGSIKCFKHLLMKGFEIMEGVISMVVCSGCIDLFHLCKVQQFLTPKSVCKASEFCHLPLLVFMKENGADISLKDHRSPDKLTPLHYAAKYNHQCIVKYLIDQKADINAEDRWLEFTFFIGLLFIMLLLMVIWMLLRL